MKAKDIIDALKKEYVGWARFEEFRLESGCGYYSEKRIDFFAMRCNPSKRIERRAFEVKISRSDFTKEMRRPLKRWGGMLFSNRFYYATPVGLIKPSELPDECGLVEVDDTGEVHVKIKAPYRETMPPTWPFVASLARRVLDAEYSANEAKEKETER